MTAVWIALGAVFISLITAVISLNAANAAKAKKRDDGGADPARATSDQGADGGDQP